MRVVLCLTSLHDLESTPDYSEQKARINLLRAAIMARKRAREEPAEDQQLEPGAVNVADVQAAALAGEQRRQATARDVARRRAAHFAHFNTEDDSAGAVNIHAGGSEARNLGPWSSARELVEQREAAVAARQEKMLEASREAGEQLKITWQATRDLTLGERPCCRVQSLTKMCTDALVEVIEHVESLWGLPDAIKVPIAAAVCQQRKLSPEVARLFTEGAPDEVILPNCVQLKQECLADALREAGSPRLERLELNMCGQGLTDATAQALTSAGELTGLRVLALGGAYRLGDAGLLAILRRAPALQVLHLPSCCRVTEEAIKQLPSLVPHLKELDLEDCRGVGAAALQKVLLGPLPALERVVLDGIPEVNDALLTEVALSTPVRRISFSRCPEVGDGALAGIAAGCPTLVALRANHCSKVTDVGVLALAESCSHLEELSLQRCHRVSDEAVAAVALKGTLRQLNVNSLPHVGISTVKALATAGRERLEELDISWCRHVSSAALGMLADNCHGLRRLSIWGCSQVDEDFLYGHSNNCLEIIGSVVPSKNVRLEPARVVLVNA